MSIFMCLIFHECWCGLLQLSAACLFLRFSVEDVMLTDITCVRFTAIIFANSWYSLCVLMCIILVYLDHFGPMRECGFFNFVWNMQWCRVLQIYIKTRSVFGDVFAELKHHAACGMKLEPDLLVSCVLRGSSQVMLASLLVPAV